MSTFEHKPTTPEGLSPHPPPCVGSLPSGTLSCFPESVRARHLTVGDHLRGPEPHLKLLQLDSPGSASPALPCLSCRCHSAGCLPPLLSPRSLHPLPGAGASPMPLLRGSRTTNCLCVLVCPRSIYKQKWSVSSPCACPCPGCDLVLEFASCYLGGEMGKKVNAISPHYFLKLHVNSTTISK